MASDAQAFFRKNSGDTNDNSDLTDTDLENFEKNLFLR